VRESVALTVVLLAVAAFVNAGRTFAGGAHGLAVSEHRLTVMGICASANRFGYRVGAAAGGLALYLGGYSLLGVVFAAFQVAAAVLYFLLSPASRGRFAAASASSTSSSGQR
jgi:predicted MFS family arabinose efflux permease